jgi:hypothetical protein
MPFKNNGGEELFDELQYIDGFRESEEEKTANPPENKDILIICTKNQNLLRRLTQWAVKTDSFMLVNPKNCAYDEVKRFIAIVIDSELINNLSIPERVSERLIPSDLDPDLIVNILNGLKPGVAATRTLASKYAI